MAPLARAAAVGGGWFDRATVVNAGCDRRLRAAPQGLVDPAGAPVGAVRRAQHRGGRGRLGVHRRGGAGHPPPPAAWDQPSQDTSSVAVYDFTCSLAIKKDGACWGC